MRKVENNKCIHNSLDVIGDESLYDMAMQTRDVLDDGVEGWEDIYQMGQGLNMMNR